MDAAALAAAMAVDGLQVHYQPIVLMPSRGVIGFEALARLRGGPTVGMGLARMKESWRPRDALAAADERLYRAKRAAHQARPGVDRRRWFEAVGSPRAFPGRSAGAALHSIGTSARHELALSTRE